MEADPLKHLLYKILNAPLRLYPYPHLYVENVFPEKFYLKLLENLPPEECYRGLEELNKAHSDDKRAYEERKVAPLVKEVFALFPEECALFWREVKRVLRSKEFLMGMQTKFAREFSTFFDKGAIKPRFQVQLDLVRDRTGYSIGPHTDSDWKIMTGLFYLPQDRKLAEFGTSVLLPKRSLGETIAHYHYDIKDFDLLYTCPFVPNAFFCFFRSAHSWHSVMPVEEEGIVRNSICWRLACKNMENYR